MEPHVTQTKQIDLQGIKDSEAAWLRISVRLSLASTGSA
jgi:hypothetical protein